MFIDAPVGAGFSYAESEFEFSMNNEEIARDILTCIKEFFKLKPKFVHVPTYVAGDSYGGKIAIEFANMWYKVWNSKTMNNFQNLVFQINF